MSSFQYQWCLYACFDRLRHSGRCSPQPSSPLSELFALLDQLQPLVFNPDASFVAKYCQGTRLEQHSPSAVGQRSACEPSEGCSTVPSRTRPHRGFERWGKGSRVLVAGVSAVGAAARISLDSGEEEAERGGHVAVLQWCLLAVTPLPQPVMGGKGWSYNEGIGSPVRSGRDFWWCSCFCHGV